MQQQAKVAAIFHKRLLGEGLLEGELVGEVDGEDEAQ